MRANRIQIVMMNENDINFKCVNQQVNNKTENMTQWMEGIFNWQLTIENDTMIHIIQCDDI